MALFTKSSHTWSSVYFKAAITELTHWFYPDDVVLIIVRTCQYFVHGFKESAKQDVQSIENVKYLKKRQTSRRLKRSVYYEPIKYDWSFFFYLISKSPRACKVKNVKTFQTGAYKR